MPAAETVITKHADSSAGLGQLQVMWWMEGESMTDGSKLVNN